jgi:Flp pilus assembly pilin Flp
VSKALVWYALLADRRGVTSVEYALIGSLIFIVIVLAVSRLGSNLQTTFNGFANNL